MHLTKRTIENLPLPAAGQAFYRDSQLKGLAVRVTAGGTKAFLLEKLVRGRVRRITLGRVGEISLEHARKLAQRLLGQIAEGRDPAEERKRTAAAAVTLDDVFRDYLAQRSLKPKTVADYNRAIMTAFSDWRRRPLAAITREAVERRFTRLRDENGTRMGQSVYARAARDPQFRRRQICRRTPGNRLLLATSCEF